MSDGGGNWLSGGFVSRWPPSADSSEPPIFYGPDDAMREIAAGVSPTLSPGGDWVAFFTGETLRLIRIDGSDGHDLVDLERLSGRDRHFSSQPDCFPDDLPGCSYRPPVISWSAGGPQS
jgi:hypothetical protein